MNTFGDSEIIWVDVNIIKLIRKLSRMADVMEVYLQKGEFEKVKQVQSEIEKWFEIWLDTYVRR